MVQIRGDTVTIDVTFHDLNATGLMKSAFPLVFMENQTYIDKKRLLTKDSSENYTIVFVDKYFVIGRKP